MNVFILLALLVSVAWADITGTYPATGTCLCLTGTRVNARDQGGLSSNVVASLSMPECYTYLGQNAYKDGQQWYYLEYSDQLNVWVTGKYLSVTGSSTMCSSGQSNVVCDSTIFVSRSEWGARAPKSVSYLTSPVGRVFIHHTAGTSCTNTADCKNVARSIQNYHMDNKGWSDIGYSFLVGEDGKVYEGRGWTRQGAHTKGYNSVSLAFSVMGNFMDRLPNQAALNAVQSAIQCGIDWGKITSTYRLQGHRDVSSTACPGDQLYGLIKTWNNYS